ncbi:hypothetical protein DFH06DRAFT_763126 [Mycena polygramma]|nr:hypothetical protein DFH06DRAFT_763126 [Mycena polygramma]
MLNRGARSLSIHHIRVGLQRPFSSSFSALASASLWRAPSQSAVAPAAGISLQRGVVRALSDVPPKSRKRFGNRTGKTLVCLNCVSSHYSSTRQTISLLTCCPLNVCRPPRRAPSGRLPAAHDLRRVWRQRPPAEALPEPRPCADCRCQERAGNVLPLRRGGTQDNSVHAAGSVLWVWTVGSPP